MPGILIFYYIGGAGGKFIANLLSYSGSVAISNYEIALRGDPAEYHTTLLNTIPERRNSREWMQREHGCAQLFGPGVYDIKRGAPVTGTLNDLTQLPAQWVPIVAHTQQELTNIQNYYRAKPQRTIVVDAVPEFIDLAIRLKWPKEGQCLDLTLYQEFKQSIAAINADYIINEWDPRNFSCINDVIELAVSLEVNSDLAPAVDYINSYRRFHIT